MQRININGTSGSGKTTFAARLAAKLGYPHIELDSIYHLPNWGERPTEEFRELVSGIVAHDHWVIDGNYTKVFDIVWARADTVIFLDYPLPLVLWRLTRRTFARGLLRKELWHGNRESLLRHLFTRDSLFLWVLQTYKKRRRKYWEGVNSPACKHIRFIRFTSPGQAAAFLRTLEADVSDESDRSD